MTTTEKTTASLETTLNQKARLVALGAHPDDIEAHHGYLLSKASQLMQSGSVEFVGAIVLTKGRKSTKGDPEFVQEGEREGETRRGIRELSKPHNNIHVHVADLPDGSLKNHRQETEAVIKDYVEHHRVTHLATLGPIGDGHPDHTESHERAVNSVGDRVTIFALNAEGDGKLGVPGDINIKVGALAMNKSQWPIERLQEGHTLQPGWEQIGSFALPPRTADELSLYKQYLDIETYDIYPPGTYQDMRYTGE